MKEHGTLVAYKIHGCRCALCTDAQRRYNNRRERLIAYGQWQPFLDAQPVRDHIAALSQAGMGWKRCAALAGISTGTMTKLLHGHGERPPSRKIRPGTAAAIMAVRADLDTLADRALVDATGTRRRLQSLVAIGWSQAKLAARLGMTPGNFSRTFLRTPRTYASTARQVRALYDELWDQPPAADEWREKIAANRARKYAAAQGWVPPAAWDDDEIDDPAATPCVGASIPSFLALAENADELIAQQHTLGQAAERLGVSPAYLQKSRQRARALTQSTASTAPEGASA